MIVYKSDNKNKLFFAVKVKIKKNIKEKIAKKLFISPPPFQFFLLFLFLKMLQEK